MDARFAAPFRQQLLAQRAALFDRIVAHRGGTVDRAQAPADPLGEVGDSRAQVLTERDLAFTLNEFETAELEAIDAALARIEAGTYGACIDCGVDIPAPRLHAAPQASRCVGCQEAAERQSARRA